MKTPRQKLVDKLDKAWRTIGKEDAVCEVCATLPPSERVNYNQLQPHHIIPRGHMLTRFDLRNRVWLCPTHHTLGGIKCAQDNVGGWFWGAKNDWLGTHRPEDKKYLEERKHQTKKWEVYELKEMLDDMTTSS